MKKIIFVLFLLAHFVTSKVQAQVVSVTNLRQNVVYLGMDNPLRIVMEGVHCTSLRVSTDNGSIQKTGSCEYSFKPSKTGMAQIVVSGGKKTYNYLLRVESLPAPAAYLGSRSGGLLAKGELERQRAIYVRYPGVDVKSGLKISTYSYVIIRDDKHIAGRSVKGPNFGRDMQQQFSNIAKSDILLFYNIVAEDDKGNTQLIAPIQFMIN